MAYRLARSTHLTDNEFDLQVTTSLTPTHPRPHRPTPNPTVSHNRLWARMLSLSDRGDLGESGGARAMDTCEPGQGGNAAAISNVFMRAGCPPRLSQLPSLGVG